MRYLFCSHASIGLLGPSITIAQELQSRGHEVSFATGPSMTPFLRQAKLNRIPRGPKDGESFDVKSVWNGTDAVRQVRHIEYACQQFSPDVLVGQALTWGAMVYRQYTHLPLAIIGQAGYFWPTNTPLPYYDHYRPSFYKRVLERYRLGTYYYDGCCHMLGIPYKEASYEESVLLGDLFLLQSVPTLEGDPSLLPDRVHFVGDCSWNPPHVDAELQQWLVEAKASGEPILYLQVGRVLFSPMFVEYLTQVLGKLSVRVVASFGGASQAITSIPKNFFVREHIMQEQVLAYANAVICSGTTTSVLGALTHGLPLLIIPANAEEPYDLAFRCLHTRSGLCIASEDATEETLGSKVEELLQRTELYHNARKIQQAFASINGPSTAADLIEALGSKRTPILRDAVPSMNRTEAA